MVIQIIATMILSFLAGAFTQAWISEVQDSKRVKQTEAFIAPF